MQTNSTPPLLATSWTSAGDARPQSLDERSPIPLKERVASVASTGWSGIGLVHADVAEFLKSHTVEELATLLDDHGLQHRELEFLSDWWLGGQRRQVSDRMRKELFEVATSIGAKNVKVAPSVDPEPVDPGRFAQSFHDLASEAETFGTRIAIEPLPFSTNLATVLEAIDLVKQVGHPAGGLCIDIWHVARGGTDYQVMAKELPREYLFVVELDDALAKQSGTLWEDTVYNRLLPGAGALDVPAFIQAIEAVGFDGPWGVEIISTEYRRLPLRQALQSTYDATARCFEVAHSTQR